MVGVNAPADPDLVIDVDRATVTR
ncbi:MAG: hypothetical protein QOE61_765, partial [Micromonosporaceae bacterium]|nr:hypothetical protein [Micromonosporaceae bacterium]